VTADTERTCKTCGETKAISQFRRYPVRRWVCISRTCEACESLTGRYYNRIPQTRHAITAEDVLATWQQLIDEGINPDWRLVSKRMNVAYSTVFDRVQKLRRNGQYPPANRLLLGVGKKNYRHVLLKTADWLADLNIGTPGMGLPERLELARERFKTALRREKTTLEALVASRYQNAQLRAEIRELQRQQEKLWQVRESYRKGYDNLSSESAS